MKKDPLDQLNSQLVAFGVAPIKDVDSSPERTAYLVHKSEGQWSDKEWVKILKAKKEAYLLSFHTYFAAQYPHLLYELGEDKVYWDYDEVVGIYTEINFSEVRSILLKLLIAEDMLDKATEATAKVVLAKYRAEYPKRGKHYEEFDANDGWFHAKNGWVNVGTLEFVAHTPTRLSRRVSDVEYDKEAICPAYDRFLDEQIQLPKDQVRVIDQFSGLLLTPDITKQKMLVLIGKPGCGKSTLLDLWSDVLGECSTQKGLTEIASESFRFGGSTLVGKTLCWFDEVEVTRANMGNSLINLVTGQHIHVERKGINGIVEVDNQLKCVLTANTLPRSAEIGIYRRMLLIYLEYSFYDNMTSDRNIRNILKAEASGVLNRMLKGLLDLNVNGGFTVMEGHEDLIEDYKTSSNTMAEFLDTYFEFDYEAEKISTKTLLEAYKEFSNDKYANTLTPQRFGVLLKQNGLFKFDKITSVRGGGGIRMWAGLRLRGEFIINPAGFIREVDQEF